MKLAFLAVFLIIMLVVSVFIGHSFLAPESSEYTTPKLFVGVDVAYDNMEEIKGLVDEISNYTNTFVIGSTGITYDINKLNEVCTYVYDKDMYFMIYMHPQNETEQRLEQRQWVADAKTRWNRNFLGLYTFDEPGGRQLDNATYKVFDEKPTNYTDAENKYVSGLNDVLDYIRGDPIYAGDSTLFTSDYALYWFDYKGGYNVVFGEFGWNYSRQLNVALDRGAATVQNKDWGVMIAWTYNHPPYLESGPRLYDDLILAYDSGAKYILIFDTNEKYTGGILEQEHLDALRQFWNYTKNNPRKNTAASERVAYVLPKSFAYGFRGPNDKIWGFWEANEQSYEIGVQLGKLLDDYGNRLDIIYEDGLSSVDSTEYGKLIFWNGTVYEP
jgi:hypothetical protein